MAAILAQRLAHTAAIAPFEPEPEKPSSRSSSPETMRSKEEEAATAVAAWSSQRVARWLSRQGAQAAAVAQAAAAAHIDGATLLELDGDAWRELGVTSAIERAKLLAAVKKAAVGEEAAPAEPPKPVSPQDATGGRIGRQSEAKMRRHFIGNPLQDCTGVDKREYRWQARTADPLPGRWQARTADPLPCCCCCC